MGWDVTEAAAAHSTLSGVLASIILVLMSIIAERWWKTAPDSRFHGENQRISHVLRLLLMACSFLILSSIIWGGLTGHPRLSDLNLATSDIRHSAVAERAVARSAAVGAMAVILLTAGALALFAGALEAMGRRVVLGSDRMLAEVFNGLVAFGAYEVCLFTMYAFDSYGYRFQIMPVCLVVFVVAWLICRGGASVVESWSIDPGRRDAILLRRVRISAVSTGALVIGAYIASPVPAPLRHFPEFGLADAASILMLVVAGITFCFYGFLMSWFVRASSPGAAWR